ncbi:ribonuclease P [Candidatus Woesearchaeota archaeon]|nr:ribonuclease P [Candidatus Woesearchaeota archaeon]
MQKKEVLETIKKLFNEAKLNTDKADRYVELARKIGMKFNVPIPRELKRKFCRHCNSYFQKSNYRIRTRNKMIVYTCFKCRKYTKFKIKD